MEQSPALETNRSSDNQEIPHILCNPTVHCRIHKHVYKDFGAPAVPLAVYGAAL
jgi:hypothetical protein